jgi:hypothetical protein
MTTETPDPILTTIVSPAVAAELLSIGLTRLGVLQRDGWIVPTATGDYELGPLVRGYLRSRLGAGQDERRARDARLGELAIAERSLALSERRASLMNLLGAMQHCAELLRPVFKKLIGDVPRAVYPRDRAKQQQLMKLFEEIRDTFEAEQARETARIKATGKA